MGVCECKRVLLFHGSGRFLRRVGPRTRREARSKRVIQTSASSKSSIWFFNKKKGSFPFSRHNMPSECVGFSFAMKALPLFFCCFGKAGRHRRSWKKNSGKFFCMKCRDILGRRASIRQILFKTFFSFLGKKKSQWHSSSLCLKPDTIARLNYCACVQRIDRGQVLLSDPEPSARAPFLP